MIPKCDVEKKYGVDSDVLILDKSSKLLPPQDGAMTAAMTTVMFPVLSKAGDIDLTAPALNDGQIAKQLVTSWFCRIGGGFSATLPLVANELGHHARTALSW